MLTANQTKYINKFMLIYGKYYSSDIHERVRKMMDPENKEKLSIDGDLLPILCGTGIMKRERDIYLEAVRILNEEYEIKNKNILDVAVGKLPLSSIYIRNIQEGYKGTVTAYDPEIILELSKGINTKKELFTKETQIKIYDCVFSFAGCDSTKLVIERCNDEKVPMVIMPCTCSHLPKDYKKKYTNNEELDWFSYLTDLTKNTLKNDGNMKLIYLDNRYMAPYPLITTNYKS